MGLLKASWVDTFPLSHHTLTGALPRETLH